MERKAITYVNGILFVFFVGLFALISGTVVNEGWSQLFTEAGDPETLVLLLGGATLGTAICLSAAKRAKGVLDSRLAGAAIFLYAAVLFWVGISLLPLSAYPAGFQNVPPTALLMFAVIIFAVLYGTARYLEYLWESTGAKHHRIEET